MSKKRGKGSQKKQKQKEHRGEPAKRTNGADIILVPFGKEVYGTTPCYMVEAGDYQCDKVGEIIRIWDSIHARGGVFEWHDVKFDAVHGDYVLADEDLESDVQLGPPPNQGHHSTPPPVKRDGGKQPSYSPIKTNRSGPEVRVIVKETGQVYESYKFFDGKDLRDSGMPFTTDGEGVPVFVLGINQLRFREVIPTVQMCAYDAVRNYVEHWCGKVLDHNDQSFFKRHQWTDKDGIGLACMPTVIHQVVEPYGLGVSRIRFPVGLYSPLEDRDAWAASLGENPLQISNPEFAEQMGQDVDEVNEMFRMDYGELPYAPSVLAYGDTTKSGGGHVTYIGPRGRSRENWQISVCIEPLTGFKYKVPLVLTPPTDKASTLELEWNEIRDEEGKKIGPGTTYNTKGASFNRSGKGNSSPQLGGVGRGYTDPWDDYMGS
jgi:hypothetical protein